MSRVLLAVAGAIVLLVGAPLVVGWLVFSSRASVNLNSTWFPLPLRYGNAVVCVVCTSAETREICALDSRQWVAAQLVNGLVLRIAWTDHVLASVSHPLKKRGAFAGDEYMEADTSVCVWTLVDVKRQHVQRFTSESDLVSEYRRLVGADASLQWLTLREARDASEEQLGFAFTEERMRDYIGSTGKATATQP